MTTRFNVWLAEATCSSADAGYVMKWFATREEAQEWLSRFSKIRAPKIEETSVPDDVVGFLEWINATASVEG